MAFSNGSRFRNRVIGLTALILLLATGFYFWKKPRAPSRIGHKSATAQADTYYCPMHPSYKSDKPGNCPICSMKLVKLESAPASSQEAPKGHDHATPGMAKESSAGENGPAGAPGNNR